MPVYLAATAMPSVQLGTLAINNVYLGTTPVWSRATVGGWGSDGFLDWINELCTDPSGLLSDPFGNIVDGLGNPIGQLVSFVQGGAKELGTLISSANTSVADAYCGVWGGSAPPDGLIGLINGIPVVGPLVGGAAKSILDLLESLFGGDDPDPVASVESIIGTVPVVGQLAQMIGLSPDSAGALTDPLNFVVDELGAVVGTLTCGQFTPTGGAGEGICYVIGVVGQAARMLIPDGLVSLTPQTSRLRNPTQVVGDDGWLETQVAQIGDPTYITQAFRRYVNSGTGASGVGIDFRNSQLSIVRRVGGTDTLVAPNLGRFSSGDVQRLIQAGDVHTLYNNGELLGSWNDSTHTAATGSGNRSVAMVMQGAKEFQGTRRFSPSLASIQAA